jgi:hypothetical protein
MAEINTRVHKVLDLGGDLNSGAGPTPLGEGVVSTWASIF